MPTSTDTEIEFFPILGNIHGWSDDPPLVGSYHLNEEQGLAIEDVSHLITPETFSLWKRDCFMSRGMADDLDNIRYAVIHRYPAGRGLDPKREEYSTELVNLTVSCLAIVRPTRRSRAMNIRGRLTREGAFEPSGFTAIHQPAEVPEVQKLFTVRSRDIDLLRVVLPEFVRMYEKDHDGRLGDAYEPMRMAVQLYEQAYALSYWKARHVLWWSAIEALYGSNELAVMARVYSLFGERNLADGYRRTIYEDGDIPSCYHPAPGSLHTLGEMLPLMYTVRNFSAHGQKVPDLHFGALPHPFGSTVPVIEALAEAATFIIRKTIAEILRRGLREHFRDRKARENFWLYHHGLDKRQSAKRLNELEDHLRRNSQDQANYS